MDRGMIGCFAQVTHPAKTLDQQVIKQRMDKVKCAHTSCSLQFIVIRHHRNHLHVYNHDQKNYQSPLRAQVSHTLSLSKGKHLAQQASSLEGGRGGRMGGGQ